jgi:hypothetical protein
MPQDLSELEEHFDERSPQVEEAVDIDGLKRQLRDRCKDATIPVSDFSIGTDDSGLKLTFHAGRGCRDVRLYSRNSVATMLQTQFEDYSFISGYDAIYSCSNETIEAVLSSAAPTGQSLFRFRRLLGEPPGQGPATSPRQIDLGASTDFPDVIIKIGTASRTLLAMTPSAFRTRQYSLLISSVGKLNHDRALGILEKIADAVLFELDLSYGIPLVLQQERQPRSMGVSRPVRRQQPINFPKYEYDRAPMSLYWYARSAQGLLLLQYLAFYQVVEYYFPVYSEAEIRKKVVNLLKHPTFSPEDHGDIGRLLAVSRATGSRGFGDERSQLKATLLACLDAGDLWGYLTEEEERKTFLSSKKKGLLRAHPIPISNSAADLREDVASRIYDIRCMIVHTKSTGGDAEIELLLPFSQEARALTHDVGVMEYIATKVLIVGSRKLRI